MSPGARLQSDTSVERDASCRCPTEVRTPFGGRARPVDSVFHLVDLPRVTRSYGPAVARAGRDERAWVRGAQRVPLSDFEALFDAHRLARTAPRTSSCTTSRSPRISHRSPFSAAVRSLDRFDRRRPFGPWLHRIVVTARSTPSRVPGASAGRPSSPSDGRPRSTLDPVNARARGRSRLLPPEQRAVMVMRYVLDYTPGGSRGLLDLPRGTVNSRLRSRSRLAAGAGGEGRLERLVVPVRGWRRAWVSKVGDSAFAEPVGRPRPRRPGPRSRWATPSRPPFGLGLREPLLAMAIVDRVREIVGVERPAPALFNCRPWSPARGHR